MRGKISVVEEAVRTSVGEDALPVVKFLKNKKNISEFMIAEKLGTEVNQTRNILYRLHTHNLVTYHKKKDREKGWYISYWTFNHPKVQDVLLKQKRIKLEKLKERLENEERNKNLYFICTAMCARLNFEHAIDYDFKCPECGNIMQQQDNLKTIDNIRSSIVDIEKELRRKN
ncbi:hypothetical protein HZB01_02460 [Candidatus Woesearchaeota archaeon]|nr:hypothetical protein [Candidatus Woesearchaeota archaeon]